MPLSTIERTGIVEEAAAKRAKFARFIDKRVRQAMGEKALATKIERLVDDRVQAEIAAILKNQSEIRARELAQFQPKNWPAIDAILQVALAVTGADKGDVLGPRRSRSLAWPRQFSVWLVKEMRPDLSLPNIGRAFNKDHTTIMYAVRMTVRRREEEPFRGWLAHPATIELLASRP